MFRLLFVFLLSCACNTGTNRSHFRVSGTYQQIGAYGGSKLELSDSMRFHAWYWNHGGHDSTVGTWQYTGKENLIRLYSDEIPRRPRSSYDPSLPHFTIKVHLTDSMDPQDITLVEVEIFYKDSVVSKRPDSLGYVYCDDLLPDQIQTSLIGTRPSFYYADSANGLFQSSMRQNDWVGKGLITVGSPTDNLIEFYVQEDAPFEDGDLYYLNNDTIFPLGAIGMTKVK